MERVTFEEYKKAIETINAYKIQCEKDLSLIQVDENLTKTNLKEAEVGQLLKVIRNVYPAKNYKKGDAFEILDKGPKGLLIRNNQDKLHWIPLKNGYNRWGL